MHNSLEIEALKGEIRLAPNAYTTFLPNNIPCKIEKQKSEENKVEKEEGKENIGEESKDD